MPHGIAVIGACRDPADPGAVMTQSLDRYPDTVVEVSVRDADSSAGRFTSVTAAAAASSDPIDLGMLCVAASVSARVLAAANRAELRTVLATLGDLLALDAVLTWAKCTECTEAHT